MRVGDSLPSAQRHNEFARALVKCKKTKLDILPDEGLLTIEPVGYPILVQYVEHLAMERCGFYSSWTITLDFVWVGVDGNDVLLCLHKKLLQRYEPRSDALWLFVIGQYTMSRMMGHLSISKLGKYHQLNDALEASQYQMVWLCNWNIVRWVRGQGWEQVVALGQKRLDHTASQSAR